MGKSKGVPMLADMHIAEDNYLCAEELPVQRADLDEIRDVATGYCCAGGTEAVKLLELILNTGDIDVEYAAVIVKTPSMEALNTGNLTRLQRRYRAQSLTPLFVDDYGKTHEVPCMIFQLGTDDIAIRPVHDDYVQVQDDGLDFATVFVQLPECG